MQPPSSHLLLLLIPFPFIIIPLNASSFLLQSTSSSSSSSPLLIPAPILQPLSSHFLLLLIPSPFISSFLMLPPPFSSLHPPSPPPTPPHFPLYLPLIPSSRPFFTLILFVRCSVHPLVSSGRSFARRALYIYSRLQGDSWSYWTRLDEIGRDHVKLDPVDSRVPFVLHSISSITYSSTDSSLSTTPLRIGWY